MNVPNSVLDQVKEDYYEKKYLCSFCREKEKKIDNMFCSEECKQQAKDVVDDVNRKLYGDR